MNPQGPIIISRHAIYKEEFPGDYGKKNKNYTGKKGMGIDFNFGEKNIFKNQQNEHPDAGQSVLGNDEGQRSVFKKICHDRIKLSGAPLNDNQS